VGKITGLAEGRGPLRKLCGYVRGAKWSMRESHPRQHQYDQRHEQHKLQRAHNHARENKEPSEGSGNIENDRYSVHVLIIKLLRRIFVTESCLRGPSITQSAVSDQWLASRGPLRGVPFYACSRGGFIGPNTLPVAAHLCQHHDFLGGICF
jgi:hypothetical protein